MNVHDFSALDITGNERKLSEFAGKVLLIVNTASACGFTPQYGGLQELQDKYAGDLVVLGFPCNQFGAQESGTNEEIASFCDLKFQGRLPALRQDRGQRRRRAPALQVPDPRSARHSRHKGGQVELHEVPRGA